MAGCGDGSAATRAPPTSRRQVLSNFTAEAARSRGGPEWLRRRRLEALDRFAAAQLPTESEEVWRYSRIDDLDLDAFAPVPADGPVGPAGPGADGAGARAALDRLTSAAGARAGLLAVRNGRVSGVELDPGLAAKGVVLGPLAAHDAAAESFGAVAGADDPFVDLATAFVDDGALLAVPAGVAVTEPIVVVHWMDAAGSAVFPRLVVRLGPAAQATVVELVASADGALLCAPVAELDVGDGANLDYLGVQSLGRSAWQLGHQASRVGRDASLRSFSVALGGWYARLRTDSRLTGQGGSARLLALYFGDGEQMHDFRTLQEHAAPKTTSDLVFKGAVRDTARGVYSGLIRVRRGAAGTNAFQTNRNLVLSEGAHADSVPNLEIEENDVRCSHASAVGPVDEDQRYYLESRGVPPEVANRLIVLGFFDDLLQRAPVAGLRRPLRAAVAAKAAGVGEAGS